jgi:hypothetical protein
LVQIGPVVLEELIKMQKANDRRTTDAQIEKLAKNHLKIISYETTVPIGPKLWWNGLSVVIFQNCVRRPRPPTKMETVTKTRKFSKKIT